MHDPVFVDTGYIAALVKKDDKHAAAARRWAVRIARERTPLVTSSLILVELGNRFGKQHEWKVLRPLVDALRVRADVVDVGLPIIDAGIAYRDRFTDKEWGLVDCTSFLIMQERGITRALSCDHHFQQAGFKALLIEE